MKCIIKTLYYFLKYPTGSFTVGHEYKEIEDGVLKCQICGHISEAGKPDSWIDLILRFF